MTQIGRSTSISRYEWEIDILGAMAERALAKGLGVYCEPTVNTFHAPDVRPLQVRSTCYPNGKLIVRPDDPPGNYVLVITRPPVFRIAGVYQFNGQGHPEFLSQPDQSLCERVMLYCCWPVYLAAIPGTPAGLLGGISIHRIRPLTVQINRPVTPWSRRAADRMLILGAAVMANTFDALWVDAIN